jgi:hypothetical protein
MHVNRAASSCARGRPWGVDGVPVLVAVKIVPPWGLHLDCACASAKSLPRRRNGRTVRAHAIMRRRLDGELLTLGIQPSDSGVQLGRWPWSICHGGIRSGSPSALRSVNLAPASQRASEPQLTRPGRSGKVPTSGSVIRKSDPHQVMAVLPRVSASCH